MTHPTITLDLLTARQACATGLADFGRICPNGLDPSDKAAVVAALRAGLGRWWGWALARGLVSADLTCANLTRANLTDADLANARYSSATVWPKGFDPVAAGAILMEIAP